ncbi:MAG: protein kinase [Deltaproteobacteria bacterium]|nr:protein kinase [Deltaproteobacteria bacterium]
MADQAQPVEAPPLGTTLGDRYELVRFLGSGGLGAVYEALTPGGEHVAVKVLLQLAPEGDDEMLARFLREGQVAARLDDEHIVPVVDSGMDEVIGRPFLVMPLLSGLDLNDLLDRTGPLHPTVAVRIMAQACRGLATAHRAGVIHRDIKPANIYLDHDPKGPVRVRVLDFGLAKLQQSDVALTRAGCVMGTPHYMSPEQSTSTKDVDERADVWSVGATLYHALTGQEPFAELQSYAALFLAISNRDVPAVQDLAPWIDPGLASVVHGALVREQGGRCPSIKELAAALWPFQLGSFDITPAMLEPVPAVLRRTRAPRSAQTVRWEPAGPRSELPAVSSEPPDPLLGQSVGGRYTLLRRVGAGAAGTVYEAQGARGNRFAVRLFAPAVAGCDAEARSRFVREARALSAIDHQHVVRFVDAYHDKERDLPLVVMELLRGTDLRAVLDRHGAIDPRLAAHLFTEACLGLAAAHRLGFVHRDLRPANLFLHELPSGELVVKLCGFGQVGRVVRPAGEGTPGELTSPDDVAVASPYMSPEQVRGQPGVDHRSDIWSVGASLFHALAGAPPWPGSPGSTDVAIAICTGPIPLVQDVAPWVAPALARTVQQALERDPAKRFQSVIELAAALAPCAQGVDKPTLRTLGPVAERVRAARAPRSEPLPLAVPARGPALGAASRAGVPAPAIEQAPVSQEMPTTAPQRAARAAARGRAVLWVLVAAVALVVAAAGLAAWSRFGVAAASRTASEAAPRFRVRVAVRPPTARVTVGGVPRPLEAGSLWIEGPAGEELAVVVSEGGRRVEATVVITRSGRAVPSVVELPAAE